MRLFFMPNDCVLKYYIDVSEVENEALYALVVEKRCGNGLTHPIQVHFISLRVRTP